MSSETIQLNGSAKGISIPAATSNVIAPQPAADINLLKQDRPVELFRSYDQGILDGLLGINTEYFEQFIDAYHFREFKNKAIHHLRGQIKELIDKQIVAENHLVTLNAEKFTKEAERESYSFKIDYIDKVINYWKDQIQEAKLQAEQIKLVKTDYTLFPGILFFLFACLFIAADYTICLSIVADTLKIGYVEGSPTFASHLFALAMSGLAVVLKPAYDRLVEKPYHNHDKKKMFNWIIITLAIAVLLMLFTLGVFREDVISSGMMDNVDVNTDINLNTEVVANQSATPLLHNEWARKIGIISSTLLFAVAGAVCLGISIPILYRNFRKHWNMVVARKRVKQEHKLMNKKVELETQRVNASYKIKEIDSKIEALLPSIQIDEEVNEKRQMISIYQHGEMVKNIAKSNSLYLAGYERGKKIIGRVPQEWLVDSVCNGETNNERTINIEPSKLSKESGIIGKRTRPFVALRRMITHNFKKKWDKENDINIEYYNFDN